MIAGLGEKTDFVAAVPNVDAARLGLTQDERTLFERVGRAAQINQLVSGSALPEAKTIALLLSLRAKGAIVPARLERAAPSTAAISGAALQEEVDLSEERKREILEMEVSVETKDLFTLLRVKPGANSKEIREAFYELSRKFHPDRYFKKNLGSYRARVELVFRKLSQAHELLTDDVKRAGYLRAHPELLDASPVRAVAAAHVPKINTAEDDAREAERRQRLARHPYLAKGHRLKELLSKAREHIGKSEWGHAFTQLNMAVQLDSHNEEAQKLLAEVRAKNDSQRAGVEYRRGQELLEQGNESGALAAFKTALSMDVRHAEAALMVAKMVWERTGDPKESQAFAQRAVDANPKNAECHVLLARIMEHTGMKALAKKHYEEALKLNPDHPEAKKQVKGRWPF